MNTEKATTEDGNLPIFSVVRSTANIDIAIKHFERRRDEYKGRLSADEVLQTLHFLKQANEQGLDIIGIGYTRYDGGDIKECSVKNMYECGFLVRK